MNAKAVKQQEANEEIVETTPNSSEQKQERLLPPLNMIIMPEGLKTKSVKIRWLRALGYTRSEIAEYLGVRYQMVRNIELNQPKRAAREDLPPLKIDVREEPDDVQLLMDHALDESLKKAHKDRKKAEKAQLDKEQDG